VVGIQNSPAVHDELWLTTGVDHAEVRVEKLESSILKLGPGAGRGHCAIPGPDIQGKVSEIGDNWPSIAPGRFQLAKGGQSGSQEAKDFKVEITMDAPQPNLRPGLLPRQKLPPGENKARSRFPIQALSMRAFKKNPIWKHRQKGWARKTCSSTQKKAHKSTGVFVSHREEK